MPILKLTPERWKKLNKDAALDDELEKAGFDLDSEIDASHSLFPDYYIYEQPSENDRLREIRALPPEKTFSDAVVLVQDFKKAVAALPKNKPIFGDWAN